MLQQEPTQTLKRVVNNTMKLFKNDKLISESIAKDLKYFSPYQIYIKQETLNVQY